MLLSYLYFRLLFDYTSTKLLKSREILVLLNKLCVLCVFFYPYIYIYIYIYKDIYKQVKRQRETERHIYYIYYVSHVHEGSSNYFSVPDTA